MQKLPLYKGDLFMLYLKCQENGCKSNYCAHCVKEMIKVSKDAYCHSYESKNDINSDEARHEFEFACEVGLVMEADMHHIVCDSVECCHNDSKSCMMKQIQISKKTCGAKCASYRPK